MKYKAKSLTPVQVGQVVKALATDVRTIACIFGKFALHSPNVTIKEIEKDRFVVTTTTETAHSKNV